MTIAHERRALTFLVAGAFFMENLDGTVLTTALPKMARSFGTETVALSVGVTAYLLALAVFVPMSGWLTDRFGARTIFAGAVGIFTLASIACGVSDSLPTFVAARIVQGIGGAMMVPVGRLVVLRDTDKRDLVRAISTIVWPGLVAPVLGPPLGGLITDHASWHWIFFLNLPLGLVALGLTPRLVPQVREERTRRFDWLGFVLVELACALLTLGLDRFADRPSPWSLIGTLVASGLLVGTLALRHLYRAPSPLLQLRALRIPTFLAATRGGAFSRCAIGAMPFLLTLYFQLGFGWSAAASGALILWVFAGNLTMKTATSWTLRRFGFRRTLVVNGTLAVLSILAVVPLDASTPYPVIAAVLFVGGMFRSMQFTAVNTLSFADVPPEAMSGASTLSSTITGLTFGLGIALGAVALQIAGLAHGTLGDPTATDFRIAFTIVALVALLGMPDLLRLPVDAGRSVTE